jgi:hypothetical protein
MGITYDDIVPWGRSFDEYIKMFQLSESDLSKKILGCGDGPASFNFGMHKSGKKVVSIDPIYQFTKERIKNKIDEKFEEVIKQTTNNQDKFIWTTFGSVEELAKARINAMKDFLSDYEKGKQEKRYVFAELPELPFEDDEFELVLSAHFLFFYSDNLSYDFHIRSIAEMLRVSGEVRIFPIVDLNAHVSKHLEKTYRYFSSRNIIMEETQVEYEFQKGGNVMVKFHKKKSSESE